MFGRMMNRYYYGKAGKGDYTTEDLPQTRMQLFWEMLRVRFSGLFKLNLLYMLAWIPAIVVLGRAAMMVMNGLYSLSDSMMQLQAGEITQEVMNQNSATVFEFFKTVGMQTLVLLIPAIAVTGPFTAGLAYVTRNWARDEHAFMLSDFWDAVKANWKQALLTSSITGLVPMMLYVSVTFYGQMAGSNLLFYIPMMLVIMVSIVWLCSLMYIYPQMVTYELKFSGLVRNSMLMAIGRLPATLGIKLLSLVPTAIAALVLMLFAVTPEIVALILAVYYIVLGFSLSRFVQASYANAVFDHYINPNIEGAAVGRGLYVDTDDEEDEENVEAQG